MLKVEENWEISARENIYYKTYLKFSAQIPADWLSCSCRAAWQSVQEFLVTPVSDSRFFGYDYYCKCILSFLLSGGCPPALTYKNLLRFTCMNTASCSFFFFAFFNISNSAFLLKNSSSRKNTLILCSLDGGDNLIKATSKQTHITFQLNWVRASEAEHDQIPPCFWWEV